MKKRCLAGLLAAVMCISLCACGKDGSSEPDIQNPTQELESGDTADVTDAPKEEEPEETEDAGEKIVSGEGVILGRENYHLEEFGDNVYIFAPEDDPEEVQKVLDSIWGRQETNQFGDARYALYFLPGEYSEEISVMVGYYTQVAGLGAMPDDVQLQHLDCNARWLGDDNNHNATCNFWRGVENLSVSDYVMWAVSQATFMRRVHLGKTLYLHDNNGWSSGGFLSNSKVEFAVMSGSQQQWLSRNCDWENWIGENWNMVFAGIEEGKTPSGTWPQHQFTDVPVVDVIREKPFLVYDEEKGFGVYVPKERTNAVGVDWDPGEFLSMDEFYIAKADTDTADTINEALQSGKHIFLTPGVYELDGTIQVNRDGAIVLGSGLATLRSMKGLPCMEVEGNVTVTLAGMLFDAGPEETEYLLAVGDEDTDSAAEQGHTLLADLFFRVGGAKNYDTNVKCCVEIHQDDVIGDNFWVWRADHGSGVGWNQNKAVNGIRVAGDDVTIYALMVEHFQEYQTIWEGEGGKTVFYQCEIPYDIPNQEEWMSHDGRVNGFASYKVADGVDSHEAYGLGIYLYNRDATVDLNSAMEVPENAQNIYVYHICTVMITGNPGMSHVINNEGGAVQTGGAREIIIEYPGE